MLAIVLINVIGERDAQARRDDAGAEPVTIIRTETTASSGKRDRAARVAARLQRPSPAKESRAGLALLFASMIRARLQSRRIVSADRERHSSASVRNAPARRAHNCRLRAPSVRARRGRDRAHA